MPPVARRIGILFALFFGLLALAAGRAAWLATVRGHSLQRAANTQHILTVTVPALRGTITDRRGTVLAQSEPADDVSATPYLVKNPFAAAARLSPVLGKSPDALARLLARRDTGFVYLARQLPADQAQRIVDMHIAGIDETPTNHRLYPARLARLAGAGHRRHRRSRAPGPRVRFDRRLRGHDGERRTVRDALGQPIDVQRHPARPLRRDDRAVAGLLHPGQGRGGARPGRHHLQAQGRHGDRHGSTRRRDPGGGQLAARRRQRHRRRAVLRHPEPGGRLHLRAGLDVQGLHGGGRAGGPDRHAADRVQPRPDHPGGRPHDRRGRGPRPRDPEHGADPGAVRATSARSRSASPTAPTASRAGSTASASASPPASTCPARSAASSCRRDSYSGSSMGNLPIGQGTAVTPMQIAAGYAAIANGGRIPVRPTSSAGSTGTACACGRGAPGHLAADVAVAADDARGVFAQGGTASEVTDPRLQAGRARPAPPTRSTRRPASTRRRATSPRSWASRRRCIPGCCASVVVDEPQGSIFGGQGGGAGLRPDHGLRPAVPEDPPGLRAAGAGRA